MYIYYMYRVLYIENPIYTGPYSSTARLRLGEARHIDFIEAFSEVNLQKQIPAQIRQLVLYIRSHIKNKLTDWCGKYQE